LRAVEAHDAMIDLYERMPEVLKRLKLIREQYGFALNRLKRHTDAEKVLKAVIAEYGPSSETNGLLGRVYKDCWEKSKGTLAARGFLKQAIDSYATGFQADWRDAFPGVNAVTLMEMMDKPDPAQGRILPVVRFAASQKAKGNPDYWDYATLLELAVLGRDPDDAENQLAEALALARASWEVDSTTRNLRLVRETRTARSEDAAWIKPLEDALAAGAFDLHGDARIFFLEFLGKGGKSNKYVKFGQESGVSEREEISKLVEESFDAREAHDWSGQCATLSKPVIKEMEENPGSLGQKGCAKALGTGFNPTLLGLLMTAFVFAYGVSGLFLSFVGDLYGPRNSLAIGAGIWGIAMACMGAAGSFASMLGLRVVLGTAEGPQFALTSSLVKRWFPKEEQGRANSVWMVGSPLGSAIGFPLTIALVAAFGWRMSFYALAALNAVIIVPLILMFIRDWPAHREAEARKAEETTGSGGMKGSVAVFLKDWRFWMILLFNSMCLLYLWGLNAWLPTYLQTTKGLTIAKTGLYAAIPYAVAVVLCICIGRFSDRLLKGDVAEATEGEGEVGLVLGHGVEQVLDQSLVAVALREQADLLAQACLIRLAERLGEGAENVLGFRDRLFLVIREQRQQAFREPGQIP